jgi:hypothetical protein
VDYGGGDGTGRGLDRKLILLIAVFTLTDLLARLPGIGPWLRDGGVPFLSMVAMLVAGAMLISGPKKGSSAN